LDGKRAETVSPANTLSPTAYSAAALGGKYTSTTGAKADEAEPAGLSSGGSFAWT